MLSDMFFRLHKMFGPIRRFVYLPNDRFICLIKTAGFSKEDLVFSFTHNNLVNIVGDKTIVEKGYKIERLRVNELVHIPRNVQKEHISWEVKDGYTILKCHKNSVIQK